ncbi:hypothetical protein J437_LFUL002472 [Ladona fulva]|uniref:Uncharacterized protein n=1 Tax=Ladona fulva TaxID=123851 RepID=A0A8K0NTY9_LADFU|nr:hypothetical protein J437_LFUL002472 [Ladona fulva]
MVSVLPYIPIQDMEEAVDSLAEILPEVLQPHQEWFEDNYIGRLNRRRNGRRPPIFPHEMWNLYNRVLNGEIRIKNYAKAAHRRLQAELGMDHPSIWKFIDGLRKVQHGRDFYYEKLIAGQKYPLSLKIV